MIDTGASLLSSMRAQSPKDSTSSKKLPDEKFSDALKGKADVKTSAPESNRANDASNNAAEQNRSESTPRQPAQTVDEKKLATRQAAMEIFLDKMQDELGVPSEDVLSAFSSLSLSEMIAPPEDSAATVISKLDLGDEDSTKALELYNEMLAMTAAAGMAQYLNNNNQEADFHVLNQKEANLQQLRQSLDNMNDKFFVTGEHAPVKAGIDQQAKIARAYEAQMQMAAAKNLPAQPAIEQAQGQKNPAGFDLAGMTPIAGQDMTAADMKAIESLNSPMTANTPQTVLETIQNMSTESVQNAALQKSAAQPFAAATNDGGMALDSGANATAENLMSTNPVVAVPNTGFNSLAMGADSSADEQDSDKNKDFDSQALTSSTTEIHKANIEKSFTINAPKASAADVQTNVKEIISQAQFLAKKGGGEMSVSLNPEGMGEVNLKVKTVNGQVTVEMVTSSDEAKKVLEKGLSELKDNLALHKLHLDTIRIDSKELSQHMDQQQKNPDQGYQEKFLSDFRDRNNSLKREMYEFGAPNVPKSQTRDNAANALYDPNSKRRSAESRRLDLVA